MATEPKSYDVLPQPPVGLTIAGSDSGGGAGIQADIAAFSAHGVFSTCAVTAVTAQNTVGVQAVYPMSAAAVSAQIDSVVNDFDVVAVKTGMLGSAEVVHSVAQWAAAGKLPHLVVDPVMVATSGDRLADHETIASYRSLFTHAAVVTPNISEAETLVGEELTTEAAIKAALVELGQTGARTVVITGGDCSDADVATDYVWTRESVETPEDCDTVQWVSMGDAAEGQWWKVCSPRVQTANAHGTGCTFSAALAANFALGRHVLFSIDAAKAFVTLCLQDSREWHLGRGRGPLSIRPRIQSLGDPV